MSKQPDLSDISNVLTSESVLNYNWDQIQEAFENTLSRDGSTPNEMEADLDLNSYDLLNVGDANVDSLSIGGVSVTSLSAVPSWEGNWVTSTSYSVNDLVQQDGNVYICVEAHTSGTFSTDLASSYWELFASKGDSGVGTGDLLASNNLSDLADADTALSNLGGGSKGIAIFKDVTSLNVQTEIGVVPGTDVQAQNSLLQDIADLTLTQGDILYYDGTDITNLGVGSAGDQLVVNSGGTAPEWSSGAGGMVQLESVTASNDATIELTSFDNSVYKSYLITLSNVIPAVNDDDLYMRTTDDGGVSYDSGASHYKFALFGLTDTGVSGDDSSSAAAQIKLNGSPGIGSDAGEDGFSGELRFFHPGLARKTMVTINGAYIDSSNRYTSVNGSGLRVASQSVDAVQFSFAGGNIEDGRFVLYGLK